jgi:hypothetical protein
MLKTLSILIAAPIALAATAAPALAETLTHDGITYVYSVEQRGKMRIITGEDTTHHRHFTLRASPTWVDGTVDGSPVSFSTRDVIRLKPEVTVTEVAAR